MTSEQHLDSCHYRGEGEWVCSQRHHEVIELADLQQRLTATEGRLAVALQALEDMFDAWIDSDAHNRCAPGECERCDKIYADYTKALQAINS